MLGEVFTIISGASSVGLAIFLFLIVFYAPANEWLRKRFERQLEREKIQLGLAADYYERRLEAYLEIWELTNQAVRTVFNASNPGHSTSWDQAAGCFEELKNRFWDRRPLLSIGVFGAVSRANSLFHDARLAARHPEEGTQVAREKWESLKRQVSSIQGQLLRAMSDDLQHAGLSALVEPNPQPTDHTSPTSGEPTEVECIRQLIAYIDALEKKLPYVGRGYVLKSFRAPGDTTPSVVLKAAVSIGAVRQGTITDTNMDTEVATLELVRDCSIVCEVLGNHNDKQWFRGHNTQ